MIMKGGLPMSDKVISFLNIKQVADKYGVEPHNIRYLINSGQFVENTHYIRPDWQYLFIPDSLPEKLEELKKGV